MFPVSVSTRNGREEDTMVQFKRVLTRKQRPVELCMGGSAQHNSLPPRHLCLQIFLPCSALSPALITRLLNGQKGGFRLESTQDGDAQGNCGWRWASTSQSPLLIWSDCITTSDCLERRPFSPTPSSCVVPSRWWFQFQLLFVLHQLNASIESEHFSLLSTHLTKPAWPFEGKEEPQWCVCAYLWIVCWC